MPLPQREGMNTLDRIHPPFRGDGGLKFQILNIDPLHGEREMVGSKKWNPRGLDNFDVCEYLSIRPVQLMRLRRNKTFPRPVSEKAATPRWTEKSIRAFKRRMEFHRKMGRKVPEMFFMWADVGDKWAEDGISRRRYAFGLPRRGT